MHRRDFIRLVASSVGAWSLPLRAQQLPGQRRIGILSGLSRPDSIESSIWGGFLVGMRELGYAEGRDFVVEYRFADGKYDRFPKLATELVNLNPDVIVVGASNGIRAVQEDRRQSVFRVGPVFSNVVRHGPSKYDAVVPRL